MIVRKFFSDTNEGKCFVIAGFGEINGKNNGVSFFKNGY